MSLAWRLCAVRCAEPDDLGRMITTEVVTLDLSCLLRLAKALGGGGGIGGVLEAAMGLVRGLADVPKIRQALGLKPRPEFRRWGGGEVEHTGVAGVVEAPSAQGAG